MGFLLYTTDLWGQHEAQQGMDKAKKGARE
jgi:hypothetical protein